MYNKNDKRRLYWLIEEYLGGRMNETTFCDEFYFCYDLEISSDLLTEVEQQAFFELSKVASRFSQYEEDHKLDPKAFSTVQELKEKIFETREKLKAQAAM